MDHDLDLMRDLLQALEARQLSPRTTVVLSLDDIASDLNTLPETVGTGLDALLRLDYVDGPGADEPGYWLFRKLTRKGAQFVRETRTPDDWARMKRRYAP